MFTFKTLQQRLMVFLILPMAVFLAAIGVGGYFYARGSLYQEWQKFALLQLKQAAHHIDMRLNVPLQWMQALANTGGDSQGTENQKWVLKKLKEQPGVSGVSLERREQPPDSPGIIQEGRKRPGLAPRVAQVSPPQFFYPPDHKTVGLRSTLLDGAGHPLGRLLVMIKLDYLMEGMRGDGWFRTYRACLMNDTSTFLAHTSPAMEVRHYLGDTQNPLEVAVLKEMKTRPHGTVVGHQQAIGYCRLQEAPWAIVLQAQENQIMAPILDFRSPYIMAGLFCLAISLIFMQLAVGPMVATIPQISRKADLVTRGDYGEPLEVCSQDEIGQLSRSFNEMVLGLKERDFISNTFGRYVDREIAAKLLQRPEASRLGGEKRQVAILVSDIRDFTPLAETLSPEATIKLVNSYFSHMVEVLRRHDAIIVDFLGDGILAFFDPLDNPLAPTVQGALRCALEMQRAMLGVNFASIDHQLPPIHTGIGIHAGEVVVGHVGSEFRAKYGIIGSEVNIAHRIQGQARGREVVVSQAVYSLVQSEVTISRKFESRLKGIQDPVTLYAVGQLTTHRDLSEERKHLRAIRQ